MRVKFNIKEKSIQEFFNERLVVENYDGNIGVVSFTSDGSSAIHNKFKDELFFKIDSDIKVNDVIEIEAFDHTRSGKKLITTYTYKAEKYDDISIKMVLIDFKIRLVTK